jgi:hypothetical protein
MPSDAVQRFELLPYHEVVAAQSAVSSEIEPQVQQLLKLAETAISRLERKELMLSSKVLLFFSLLLGPDYPRPTCRKSGCNKNRDILLPPRNAKMLPMQRSSRLFAQRNNACSTAWNG